jgi:hypothetical protein
VQLQAARKSFAEQGLKVAAISYDSPAVLKDFADRHGIEFPLLADPDSTIIRTFGVLNADAKGNQAGMAHPGFFVLDPAGIVRNRYFEAVDINRDTPNSVLRKLFPALLAEVGSEVKTSHLQVTLLQSDRSVAPGSRITLIASVSLPRQVHVYAPGVAGYKPILLTLHPSPGLQTAPPVYPPSKTLYLKAIQEKVPVFEGRFEIRQDVTLPMSPATDFSPSNTGRTLSITGELSYQACDTHTCYLPASVAVTWTVQILPLDTTRSPVELRRP